MLTEGAWRQADVSWPAKTFPVANSSVVQRKRNEPAEACPTPPCLLGTVRTGTLPGPGMVWESPGERCG